MFFSLRILLSMRRAHVKAEENGKQEGTEERICCDLTFLSSQWWLGCRKWRCWEWRSELEPGKGGEEMCFLYVYFLFLTTYIYYNWQWIKLIFSKLRLFTPDRQVVFTDKLSHLTFFLSCWEEGESGWMGF